MIAMPSSEARKRVENWIQVLGVGSPEATQSTVGGGSLPGQSLPSFALLLAVKKVDHFLRSLREQSTPIIARTENDQILLDPRAILYEQENSLLVELENVLNREKHEI